jgi:hypothetical protein
MRALLWSLFAWWAWDQPDTVVESATGEGAALASIRLDGVGSGRHFGGEYDS